MLPANAWPNYNELEPNKARMNPVQVKMLIFAIRAVDWLLIIALSGYLLYAYQGGSSATYLVTVGIVGSGNIADSHYGALLGDENVRIIGVCDVDRERREEGAARVNQAYGNKDCRAHADFRELNRRGDIDTVFVCTPDHWHALVAIDAMRNGKDVYIEKPMTLTIEEGRAVDRKSTRLNSSRMSESRMPSSA